jgi:hypothetical protein
VRVSEDQELPPQPPPYSQSSSANTTPSRPMLPPRAANFPMASSPPMAEIIPQNLIDIEEDDRGDQNFIKPTNISTGSSIGVETATRLNRSSASTSVGMEPLVAPGAATGPDLNPTNESTILLNTSETTVPKESIKGDGLVVFCSVCSEDVTNDEFYYTCDDCVDDGWDNDQDSDFGGSAGSNPDPEDDDINIDNNDDGMDDSLDVCQKCFASGAQGPDHAGHKFVKKMIVSYGESFDIFPYPERQVFMHDSNIVKALKEGDYIKLIDANLSIIATISMLMTPTATRHFTWQFN